MSYRFDELRDTWWNASKLAIRQYEDRVGRCSACSVDIRDIVGDFNGTTDWHCLEEETL